MRIIKKLILYTTIIGAILFSILVVFGFLYQDQIAKSLQAELNRHLNAEIKVAKIELSFISNFPLGTVILEDVVGFESKNYGPQLDTLFVFETFELSFNILNIIDDNYVLNEIQANKGRLNLEIDKEGKENYLIFNSSPDSSSVFSLNLQKVKLIEVEIGFRDFSTPDKYRCYFENTIANGTFSDTQVHTALYGDIVVKDFVLEKTPYLIGEKAFVDIGLGINLETGSFQITRGFLTLRESFRFEVKGKTNAKISHYTFDAQNLDIKKARTLVPKKHLAFLKDYEITGNGNVFLDLNRNMKDKYPSLSGKFDVINGIFTYTITGEDVEIKSVEGTFDLGKDVSLKSTTIVIPSFSLKTNEAKVEGAITLKNLEHPRYDLKVNGRADLYEVSKLADLGESFGMGGAATFDIAMKGTIQNIDSITHEDVRTISGKGDVELVKGFFKIEGLPQIEQVQYTLKVNPKDAVFSKFSAVVAQSKTIGNARLHNWLDYVMKKSKRLDITGNIHTEIFDVADWTSVEKEEKSNEDFTLPEHLSFKGHVKMGSFRSNKTILTNLESDVVYFPRTLQLSNTYFDSYDGRILTNIRMSQWANGFGFRGDITMQSLDLKSFLKTYDDFGIEMLKEGDIHGDLFSNFTFNFTTDNKFNINKSTIEMDGDLMLLNGEIIENKLLYNIPKEVESNKIIALFVNLDLFEKRLHHIKFDTLSNHLTIKNGVLEIPGMTIKSTALNIGLQGTHTFENDMDYYLNFNLNNVLGKKDPITDEYGFIEDDADGNRNMYLHLYTKKGEIVVDVDRFGSKKIIQLPNSQELNVAKSILKEELGLFKNDTSVVVVEKEETFEYDIDLGEFADTLVVDSTTNVSSDTVKKDSTVLGKILKKKKKKKKDNFEEWDVEDEDF